MVLIKSSLRSLKLKKVGLVMYIRYLQVKALAVDKTLVRLNRVCVCLGFVISLGVITVGNFQVRFNQNIRLELLDTICGKLIGNKRVDDSSSWLLYGVFWLYYLLLHWHFHLAKLVGPNVRAQTRHNYSIDSLLDSNCESNFE